MNPEAKEYLDLILSKSPSELTKDQLSFLKARRNYLTDAQKEDYKSILNPNQTPAKGTVKKTNGKS